MNVNKLETWILSNNKIPDSSNPKEYNYMIKIIKDGFNKSLKDRKLEFNDPYMLNTEYPNLSTRQIGSYDKYSFKKLYKKLSGRLGGDYVYDIEKIWRKMKEIATKKDEKAYDKFLKGQKKASKKQEKDYVPIKGRLSVKQKNLLYENLNVPIKPLENIFSFLDPKSKSFNIPKAKVVPTKSVPKTKAPKTKAPKKCKDDEILNEKTNRCVKKSGKIGKNILKNQVNK
jgi:hypothetical protein